jgi:hypothetical protein
MPSFGGEAQGDEDDEDDPFDELFKDELEHNFDGFDSDEDTSNKKYGLLKSQTFVGTP